MWTQEFMNNFMGSLSQGAFFLWCPRIFQFPEGFLFQSLAWDLCFNYPSLLPTSHHSTHIWGQVVRREREKGNGGYLTLLGPQLFLSEKRVPLRVLGTYSPSLAARRPFPTPWAWANGALLTSGSPKSRPKNNGREKPVPWSEEGATSLLGGRKPWWRYTEWKGLQEPLGNRIGSWQGPTPGDGLAEVLGLRGCCSVQLGEVALRTWLCGMCTLATTLPGGRMCRTKGSSPKEQRPHCCQLSSHHTQVTMLSNL